MRTNPNLPKNADRFEIALSNLRKQVKGVDVDWLASETGLPRVTVKNFVSGQTKSPHGKTIDRIEEALGLRIVGLLTTPQTRSASAQVQVALPVANPVRAISRRVKSRSLQHVRLTPRVRKAVSSNPNHRQRR